MTAKLLAMLMDITAAKGLLCTACAFKILFLHSHHSSNEQLQRNASALSPPFPLLTKHHISLL